MINNLTKYMSISKPSDINNQSTAYFYNKKNAVSFGPGWSDGVYRILTASFLKLGCLISKPVYDINSNNVKISLVVYMSPYPPVSAIELSSVEPVQVSEVSLLTGPVPALSPESSAESSNQKSYPLNLSAGANPNSVSVLSNNPTSSWSKKKSGNVPLRDQSFTKSELAKLKSLVILLSRYLSTNVELDIARVRFPYHDSNILAQYIGINGRYQSFGRIKKVLFRNAIVQDKLTAVVQNSSIGPASKQLSDLTSSPSKPVSGAVAPKDLKTASILTGIKFRVSGRLAKQRVVPKRTVRRANKGGVSITKLNLVTCSTYTGKNKKGAFSIRVWLGHGIQKELR